MSSREIDALMGRAELIETALQRIPGDLSLTAAAEEIPWDALHELYAAFGGIPGIGLAKATKALHKKRPHLIPMLDSYVAGYLRSVEEIPVGDFADEALGLTRSYKVDLDANSATLVSVQHGLNEHGYTLGLCRILDLYTWAYAARTRRRGPPRRRSASSPARRRLRPLTPSRSTTRSTRARSWPPTSASSSTTQE